MRLLSLGVTSKSVLPISFRETEEGEGNLALNLLTKVMYEF
ncbi:hypothetical protein D791_03439 [Nitrincola nitratireducens]|uniref:Uncharacterized protein n=1 Tax=Nitrincola nitratireducens TaxID=1229521 RepID=W9V0C8_9GAMM|nr:hypothetical protein D791_03439 [Nitrincola nitratireducens]